MPIILIVVSLLLFIFAFFIYMDKRDAKKNPGIRNIIKDGVLPKHCPLCGCPLKGAEKVHSIVYGPDVGKDRRCHILGCPNCYPVPKMELKRLCPVCKKEVPLDGFLVTRMFIRGIKSHHVHIIGCTGCTKTGVPRQDYDKG